MRFSRLTFDDSGMYQCIAENHHGLIYATAELRVYGESHLSCSRDLKVTTGGANWSSLWSYGVQCQIYY